MPGAPAAQARELMSAPQITAIIIMLYFTLQVLVSILINAFT